MIWTVKYKLRVENDLKKMRPNVKREFAQAVKDLQEEGPFPKGWYTKELKGSLKGLMSLRLDYRHRLIYSVFNNTLTIEILEVSRREGAYD